MCAAKSRSSGSSTLKRGHSLWPGLVAACFGASACGDAQPWSADADATSTPSAIGQSAQPIVGGETDREHIAVFAIATITERAEGLCTGTLIAPNLVLTARHCVVPITSNLVDCGETTFAAPYESDSLWVTPATSIAGAELFPVREILVPPNDNASCGTDIALLILNGQFSSRIAPITPRLDLPAARGEAVTAVGFGSALTEGDPGLRRAVSDVEVLCQPGNCGNPDVLTATEFLSGQGVCEGDSGGPALDADERVVGVASRTGEDCGFAVYSAVAPWRDWIVSTASRALSQGDYDAPEWLSSALEADSAAAEDVDGVTEDEPAEVGVLDPSEGSSNPEEGDLTPENTLGDGMTRSARSDSGCALRGVPASSGVSAWGLSLSLLGLSLGLRRRRAGL